MAVLEGHLRPDLLEAGVVFSTKLADRIFRETGVRANYRARKQWGKGKKLTLSGPAHKLENALQLVNRYGREEVRPPPQAGDSPHQEVRTKPEGGRMRAHTLCACTGHPREKRGNAGSRWGHARLGPENVAVGQASPRVLPNS